MTEIPFGLTMLFEMRICAHSIDLISRFIRLPYNESTLAKEVGKDIAPIT